MKKLILIAHPRPDESVVHKQWMAEAAKQPENYTLHNICTAYPDGNIDILSEQQLIENHDELIIQFPCFWFSTPLSSNNGRMMLSAEAGHLVAGQQCAVNESVWRYPPG